MTTVKRAVVQQRETGSLERQPIPGYPRRIGPGSEQEARLGARLEAAPDATVLEHCAWWAEHEGQQLSEATMWRAIRRLGWTHKESHWQPANATRRRAPPGATTWPSAAQRDPAQVVFVDESGTHTSLTRRYGWAPHDQRVRGAVPRKHGKNTTLVAALMPAGLQEPWLIEGAMTTETCAWYIQQELAPGRRPGRRPGQVVELDNLSAHQAAGIGQAIESRGCDLLFLPPYAPDFTPIEQEAFSKLKALLRGLGARTHAALQEAVRRAIEAITPNDAAAWFAHAGYPLTALAT